MKPYELLLIISGKLDETEVNSAVLEIKELFKKHQAKIVHESNWGRMQLAYPIKHQESGTYMLWHLDITPESIAALDKELKINEKVLRILLIERPKHGQIIEAPGSAKAKEEAAKASKGKQAKKESPTKKASKSTDKQSDTNDDKLAKILAEEI